MKQKNIGMNVITPVKHVMAMVLKIDKGVLNVKNIII